MTLEHSSRSIEGHREVRSVPRVVAASHAPVAEPRAGNGQASGQPRSLSPGEATAVARAAQQERARRTVVAPPEPEVEPEQIPSLPPAARPPARLTPVVLVLGQMLIDVIAIGGAFILAYKLR